MTVKERCDYLGWSISELARRASIDWRSAQSAYYGTDGLSLRTKGKIAAAISEAMGQQINVGDIKW